MIITLTTDFGLKDPFVGVMKGVILGIAPEVRIVDISHDIPSYDILDAAIVVHEASRYFPDGTIHVVVVDPGVGGARRPIAIQAIPLPKGEGGPTASRLEGRVRGTNQLFLAPDNGALSLVIAGAESSFTRHITNSSLFHHPVSQTFHGRDIFAPVAAHLAAGKAFESVGPIVNDVVQHPADQTPTILRVDKFGNLLTNIRHDQLGSGFAIRVGGIEIRRILSNYEEALPGEIFAIEGSSGLIELSMNQGSGALRVNEDRGVEIEVETGTLNP